MKKSKYVDLFEGDCEVLDLYRNKVIVKISEKENLIAKKVGKIQKGDKVNIFKMPTISKILEVFIYISPIYYLVIGFVFGFLFGNDLFHYLLVLGLSVFGFIQFYFLKRLINKMPETYYVVIKNKVN